MTVGDIVAHLRLDMTQYRQGLDKATHLLEKHNAVATRAATILMGVGAAIGGAYTLMVREAVGFEAEMRNVNSILKESEEGFAALSEQVLGLAGRVGQAPATLARGLYDIASSGFKGAEGLKVLEAAALAATAGLSDTATASKAITAVLNAYGMTADEASRVSDVLFKTVEIGVITFADLSQNIGDVISTAAQANVPLEELAAAISALTLAGVQPAEAMTSLNQVMLSFIKPTDDAKAAAAALGIELTATELATVGLAGSMQKIATALGTGVDELTELAKSTKSDAEMMDELGRRAGKTSEQLARIFPNVRALRGALVLASQGGRTFADSLEQTRQSTGATAAAFAEQSKSLAVQWRKAWGEISAVMVRVGSDILVVLRPVLALIKGIAAVLNAIPGPVRVAMTVIALLTGAFASASAVIILYNLHLKEAIALSGGLMAATAGMAGMLKIFALLRVAVLALAGGFKALWVSMGPIGWVITGIIVAGTALWKVYDLIRDRAKRAADAQLKFKDALGMGDKATVESVTKLNDLLKKYRELTAELEKTRAKISGVPGAPTAEERPEVEAAYKKVAALQRQLIDLRNQIAEQAPKLVAGYDAEGNAILKMGEAAGKARADLKALRSEGEAAASAAYDDANRRWAKARMNLEALQRDYEAAGFDRTAAGADMARAKVQKQIVEQKKLLADLQKQTEATYRTLMEVSGAAEEHAATRAKVAGEKKVAAERSTKDKRIEILQAAVAAARKAGASEATITAWSQNLRVAEYAKANDEVLNLLADVYEKLGQTDKAYFLRLRVSAQEMLDKLAATFGEAKAGRMVQEMVGKQLAEVGREQAQAARQRAQEARDAAMSAEQRWADAVRGHEDELEGASARVHRIRMQQIQAEAAEIRRSVAVTRGAAEAELEARQYVAIRVKELAREEAQARAEAFEKTATEIVSTWQTAMDALATLDQARLDDQKAGLEAVYNAGKVGARDYADQLKTLGAVETVQIGEHIDRLGRVLQMIQQINRARRAVGQAPLFAQQELSITQQIIAERRRMTTELAAAEKTLADRRKQWAQEELNIRRQMHDHEMSMIELHFQYQRDLATARGVGEEQGPRIAYRELEALRQWRQTSLLTAQEREQSLQRELQLIREIMQAEGGGPRFGMATVLQETYAALREAKEESARAERMATREAQTTTAATIQQAEDQATALREQIAGTVGAFGQAMEVLNRLREVAASIGGIRLLTPEQVTRQRELLSSFLQSGVDLIKRTGLALGTVADQVFAQIRRNLEGLGGARLRPAVAGAAAGPAKVYNFYYQGKRVAGATDVSALMDQIAAALEREHASRSD